MEATNIISTAVTLAQRDRSCIWHPFTQMQTARDSIPLVRGQGVYLFGENGFKYIDGISSWWVNLHGHSHPHIVDAIKKQAGELEHAIFADFTHRPAIELAERLLQIFPGSMSKVFYSDNGSTAVEIGIKMALQYWHNKNALTKRKKVICFNRGYHGDTFGAMSVSGKTDFNRPFWSHLFEVESIDPPYYGHEEHSLKQLKDILKEDSAACFIFEPIILGVGGMTIYSATGLDNLLKACRDYDVICIADEVMTGFGRTGLLFACDYLIEQPDIICLAKGLTGGFLPLSVTACKSFIYEGFLSRELSKAFLHGHSYTANPLACAAALASLDLLEKDECALQRRIISDCHINFCLKWRQHPKLKRCESLGTILVLEYASGEAASYFHSFRDKLYYYFLENGILLRPLGNVLYVLPPYCISSEELNYTYDHIINTLEGQL
jgi:adenosylmethionine---8-amino-7-oxononanoate aminotransferase